MNTVGIVRSLMEIKGVRPTDLSRRLGITRQALNDRFKHMKTVENFRGCLVQMDYKLVAVPSSTRIKDDWYEVTVEE